MKAILNFIGATVFYLFALAGLMLAGATGYVMADRAPADAGGWYYAGYVGGSVAAFLLFLFVGRLLRFVIAGRWSHD